MVLQLVGGLTKPYRGVGTVIRQSNPLPPFYKARSMLVLEEVGLSKEAGIESAMVGGSSDDNPISSDKSGRNKGKQGTQKSGGGRRNNGRKNNYYGGHGGGRDFSGGKGGQNSGGYGGQPSSTKQQQQYVFPWGWYGQGWPIPPCPFPTQGWARSNAPPQNQSGLLGPRPQQAYMQQAVAPSQPSSYAPTDIAAAMHTMSLQQPDPSWYMDTGATSHMTSSSGSLSSYFNLSNHSNNNIIVGNGHRIPILGYGHTNVSSPCHSLSLNNVLHAPKLIKNLIFVRKFTKDNSVSVEFDPFWFFYEGLSDGETNNEV